MPDHDFFSMHEVDPDAPVRARFRSNHVTFVGSDQGCGCGFNAGDWDFNGFTTVDDVIALRDALTPDEQEALRSRQRSRLRLHRLVRNALQHGSVELHTCWAGEEGEVTVRRESIRLGWILQSLAPFEEGVTYDVVP